MGAELVKIFNEAKAKGGQMALMRMAMKVGFPAERANEKPDSPDLVQKAKNALKEIVG